MDGLPSELGGMPAELASVKTSQKDPKDLKLKEDDEFTGVKDFPYPGPEQVLTLDPKQTVRYGTSFY